MGCTARALICVRRHFTKASRRLRLEGGSGIGIVRKGEAGIGWANGKKGWSTCLVFGHMDEHTHDVNNAISTGRHIRHHEGLARNHVNTILKDGLFLSSLGPIARGRHASRLRVSMLK